MKQEMSIDDDTGFDQDMDRIQSGYSMLNNIEQKLRSYLSHGTSPLTVESDFDVK